jgi:hypothetical protein
MQGENMPYKSEAQRRFFHSPAAKESGITDAQISEHDAASKGKKLPERIKKKKRYLGITK